MTTNNKIEYMKNGNIDTRTHVGKMYFCFAEDEYPVIQKEHPEFSIEQCDTECESRWYNLKNVDIERYQKYEDQSKKYVEKYGN